MEVSTKQKHVTPDEIVEIAKNIWKEITESNIKDNDFAANETLLQSLHAKHKDFAMSFPIILRWMVHMRKFSTKALKMYLLKHESAKLDSAEAFLRLQAEYLVIIFRLDNASAHIQESVVHKYREYVVKQLLDEEKEFNEVQAEVEKQMELDKQASRARLLEQLLKLKDGASY